MNHGLACLALVVGNAAWAQTTTSVQNGDWSDPSTWDCNCVPEVVDAVVVHQVRIAGNTFLFQRVHVMPVGSLVMDAFFSVAIMDTVINDGLMDLIGDIDVDWALFIRAPVQGERVHQDDALLVMGGPDALLTTDNIGNYGTIEGEGRICVVGFSENTGTIQGQIDFCDLTPTVSSSPFIDVNTGTVAGSVTFCEAGSCGPTHVATRVGGLAEVRIGPVPAQDVLVVDAPSGASIALRDAIGNTVRSLLLQGDGPFLIEVTQMSSGAYVAEIRVGAERRMLRLLIER